MKIRTISFGMAALAVAVLGSCSDNEHISPSDSPSDNAIRFAANTDFSRAGDITTSNLSAFNVYAYTGMASNPTLFMDNVEVTKTGSNTWTYSPLKYWPAHETVDFYALRPGFVGRLQRPAETRGI